MSNNQHKRNFINMNGGIDILLSHFYKIGIWKKIDQALGKRAPRAEYSKGEVFATWIMTALSGGKRLEHAYQNRTALLKHPKFNKGMSPDTISRVFRSLAEENIYFTRTHFRELNKEIENEIVSDMKPEEKIRTHEVNNNQKLNELVLDTAIFLGLLKTGEEYILDIDATIIETTVLDSRPHYKGDGLGYSPLISMLNGIPIYLESRNGNSNAMFRLKAVLKNSVEMIESRGLKVKLVRSDAAASTGPVLQYLLEKKIPFIIRAHRTFTKKSIGHVKWKEVIGSKQHLSAANTTINMQDNTIRLIWYKKLFRGNRPGDKYNGEERRWGILTDNFDMDEEALINQYNMRGSQERVFAYLNDLGMKYMPHRELKFNTVYMIITMLVYVFFIYSKRFLSLKNSFVNEKMEPRTFVRKFIQVLTKWSGTRLRFYSRQMEYVPFMRAP